MNFNTVTQTRFYSKSLTSLTQEEIGFGMLLFNVKLLFFSNVVLLYGLRIDEIGSTNIYFVGVESSFSRLRV